VRRIEIEGTLGTGVYAKDVILHIIRKLGVSGGKGFAYEYGGSVIERMSMEERMTVCNMSIEGGALAGYVNPDQTTFDYLKGRPYAPAGAAFDRAVAYWKSVASDADAHYDEGFLCRQRYRANGYLGHQSRPVGGHFGKAPEARSLF
jgi:3-isopropylmalate/(R)-2-methylmalate dehydratase large subunit